MSFTPDNTESERTLQDQNEEIILLLKAALTALELIADLEDGSLIDDTYED